MLLVKRSWTSKMSMNHIYYKLDSLIVHQEAVSRTIKLINIYISPIKVDCSRNNHLYGFFFYIYIYVRIYLLKCVSNWYNLLHDAQSAHVFFVIFRRNYYEKIVVICNLDWRIFGVNGYNLHQRLQEKHLKYRIFWWPRNGISHFRKRSWCWIKRKRW